MFKKILLYANGEPFVHTSFLQHTGYVIVGELYSKVQNYRYHVVVSPRWSDHNYKCLEPHYDLSSKIKFTMRVTVLHFF